MIYAIVCYLISGAIVVGLARWEGWLSSTRWWHFLIWPLIVVWWIVVLIMFWMAQDRRRR